MAGRRTQFSVGVLVLAGIGLLAAFLIFFAGDRLRGNQAVFETYIRESVQGLEAGATVRYRGVAVGRVTELGLVQNTYRRPQGEAFAGAFQLVLVRFSLETSVAVPGMSLQDSVREGLRARLASQGITGVSYIELDFVDPDRSVTPTVPWTPAYPWIPAVPSTVAQVQTAAEQLLRRLQDVDFQGLVANVAGLIGDLRSQTGSQGDLAGLLHEARELLAVVRTQAEGTDVAGAVRELRDAAGALRGLVDSRELRQAVAASAQAAGEFRQAAQRLPATIQQLEAGLRTARSATTDVQADLVPILRDLRSTVANLRDTTEALRRSPSQLLLGAPPPATRSEGAR
ncbi:MAG: MlaD family protein [Acetobacteraceae bacterium]|nr:MlaD family protein [Acetobacteraceae bacterium]